MEGEPKLNQEKEPKKIFLEIGTHDMPLTWLGEKEFSREETYIGIDIDQERLIKGKERTEREHPYQENLNFVTADGSKLPLQEDSVDNILLGNVMGDPTIDTTQKENFLKEAKRVLKKEGQIIIKENNTPLPFDELDKIIEKAGLEVDKVTTSKQKEWKKEITPYYRAGKIDKREGYIVYLKSLE